MMSGQDIRNLMARARPLLPVLVIEQPEQAVPLAEALFEGGVRVIEVTLRTPQALEAVERICNSLPELAVGVGTVLQTAQIRQTQDAGACFAVSPGFTLELSAAMRAAGMPWLPGVATASEVMQALAAGHDCLKLFPGGGEAGLALLNQLAGPFSEVTFCPSGGIRQADLPAFLARSNVLCCGGSWLAPASLQASGDWAGITRLAQAAMQVQG